MGKSITTTTGYRYYVSEHICLVQGPVDAFTRIRFGEKVAWSGDVRANSEIYINQPNLFGGDNREGGVVGYFDLVMGSKTEQANPFLSAILPDGGYPIPGFRGVAQIIAKDIQHCSNNPNLRPISIECERIPSKGWYDAKASPGPAHGVNPAHIIREMLVSDDWGLGYPESELDDASFRAAADTLYSEAFGLIFVWLSEGSVHEFITTVIQHIQGSLYIDPFTGLFTLTLVRGGYNVNTLLTLDESNVLRIESFERTGIDELVNQVTIIWHDYILDRQQAITAHNPAIRELQGGVVATTREMPGVPDSTLAHKIASREIMRLSSPVSKAVLVANRKAANLKLGDVFKLTDTQHGLRGVVMRVGRIEYGTLDNNSVRIHAVEDIFSFGKALYSPPGATLWQDPISEPAPCPLRRVTEVPYIVVERTASENQTSIDAIDTLVGFVSFQGTPPSRDAFSAKLYTRASGGTYTFRINGRFCPTAVVSNLVVPELSSVLNLTGIDRLSVVSVGTYAYLNEECVEVTAITSTTVTVNRGILDTVPVTHAANSRIWFAEDHEILDKTQWASGVSVNVKVLPQTGKGVLALAAAPENSLVINRRWYRPYPPGNLRVNGLRWPAATISGALSLSWSHRDRTLQVSNYVRQDAGDFGPEAGTTYTIRVYRVDGSLARTTTGVTGSSWTYTTAMETADLPGNAIRFTIAAVRGGLESWQANTVTVFR